METNNTQHKLLKENEQLKESIKSLVEAGEGYDILVRRKSDKQIAELKALNAELLETLKDLIVWANIKDGSPSQYLRDKALQAIAKAEGK